VILQLDRPSFHSLSLYGNEWTCGFGKTVNNVSKKNDIDDCIFG